jgi:hypothetical protein
MQLQSMRTAHYGLAGDGERAVQSLLTSLKTRSALDLRWQRPLGADVATILSFTSPAGDALAALATELRRHDDEERVTNQVLADRARQIEYIFRQFYGGDPQAPHAYRLPLRSFMHLAWRPYFTHRFVDLLRRWERRVAASRLPWPEKRREIAATYSRSDDASSPERKRLRRWGFPRDMDFVLIDFSAPFVQIVATERAAVTAIAVARFRRDTGRLPASLNELAPTYLPEVPQDPASGQPLLYKVTPEAFTIYSVGPDGKDDGGDLSSSIRTIPPLGHDGRDIGLRVLTPDH